MPGSVSGFAACCGGGGGAGGRVTASWRWGCTRQYVAGELSVLLGHLQAVTTSEASGREAWSLRHAAGDQAGPGPWPGGRARAGVGGVPVLGFAERGRPGRVQPPGGGLRRAARFRRVLRPAR